MARTEQAGAFLTRFSVLHRVVSVDQLLLECSQSHSSFLRCITQLSKVRLLGRVALEPVARPALLAAHADVLVLTSQRQLEVAEPLDDDLARSVLHCVRGPANRAG